MESYLVTFDLGARKDYPELWGILKRSPYWHCLGPAWIVKSEKSARELFTELAAQIDPQDRMLIVRVAGGAEWTASFPAECQEWLRRHL